MPLFVPKTLLQAAQGGAQTKRYRDFVIAYFEGEGAIAVPLPVWQPAAAWAGGRQPCGNRMRDRGMLLQRLDVLVTRRGTTIISTTGGMVPLARLRNAMKSEGVDLTEWNFPPNDVLDKALDPTAGADADAGGPGTLARVDEHCVKSSKGFEVRRTDEYTVQYSDGKSVLVIRGVPAAAGGKPSFRLRPGAFAAAEEQDRARLVGNFVAAMAFLGVSVSL
ncbi:MAG: hypothetical protein P4L83_23175 [Nevskia sp.]|nr:hypothetical protein [Nevskia sp.]